ncbi:MAG: hypothetical protein ACT6QO_17105, partial [Brevundimonas aurantiaca]|uniref:hypothetical protein n=1 Tax=Brevundimonas aurantiaca TaxID=74316 RepID=UPI00403375D8
MFSPANRKTSAFRLLFGRFFSSGFSGRSLFSGGFGGRSFLGGRLFSRGRSSSGCGGFSLGALGGFSGFRLGG